MSALQTDLARRLEKRLGRVVRLVLHENRTVMVSFRWSAAGFVSIRLHHMFLSAGVREVDALVRFALRKDGPARKTLESYLARYSHLAGVKLPRRDPAAGEVYDLRRMFQQLNRRWFGGRLRASVEWGSRARRLRTRTIRLGYYDETARRIVINPALDRRDVPRFVVEWIVFHEMLHARLGFREVAGRLIAHSAEFRRRESEFPHFRRASEWEQSNLDRLLQA